MEIITNEMPLAESTSTDGQTDDVTVTAVAIGGIAFNDAA